MAQRFVPAADEVWRLQRGSDADCLFFQKMVNGGKPITDKGTRQGIWVGTAGGVLLARINSNNADKVLATLEKGWEAWEVLSEEQKRLPEEVGLEARHRWENSRPYGGLVLERVVRDVPVEGESGSEPIKPWNIDYAWFTAEEARGWLPADPQPGDVHAVPMVSALRLARFHLVDNVRGQTLPFAEEEVLQADFEVEVARRDGARVLVEIRGATDAEAADEWLLGESLWMPNQVHPHGLQTRIYGQALFDLTQNAFVEFELVALGRRWGRTVMNGRGRNQDPGLIGFHLTLAPEKPAIAPTFIVLYNADWVDFEGTEVDNF